MNPITLYGIYKTTRDNKAPDLTVGLAMFKAEHPEAAISHEENKAIREFIGKHSKELADGFAKGFDAFAETVAACEIEDAEAAE